MDSKKALKIMAAICSKKEYCSADIIAKLELMELTREDIDEIIGYLIEHKFIDNTRYTAFYVRDKFRFNKWGKMKITQMLRMKDIDTNLIEDAFEQIQREDYDETCTALLRQKAASINESDPYKAKAKLYRFALSRGFETDTISRCLSQLDDNDR